MSANLFDLTGKTALITGSSRGIGRALAEGLAGAGAAIILNGISAERLESAAGELRAAGHKVSTSQFDVNDEKAIEAAFDGFDRAGVEVDILVNNAGIQLRKPLINLTTAEWQRVIDTNLTSAFIVGRIAAKRMLARGRGKIINIGSLTSALARKTITPYAVSKSGIKMLTQQMAAEWAAQGIQANAIGPGYIETDINVDLRNDPAFDSWLKQRTPAGRWAKPQELVGTAIFLASGASDYVNGQIIYVDGGMLAVM